MPFKHYTTPEIEGELHHLAGGNSLAESHLYLDNGKIFVSQWLRLACAKLRIRHLNTKAYSPKSKGKIERFNRTVEEFLQVASLEKVETLEQLNKLFRDWLSEGYNHRVHSA